MNIDTIKHWMRIAQQRGACQEQMQPFIAAIEDGDTEHALAIARGNREWILAVMKLPEDVAAILDNGPSCIYSSDGTFVSYGDYKDGLHDGEWFTYHGNGRVRCHGMFERGTRVGVWTAYYPSRALEYVGGYKDGLRDGEWKFYYENGKIHASGSYKAGDRIGVWEIGYEDGRIVRGEYIDGWFWLLIEEVES